MNIFYRKTIVVSLADLLVMTKAVLLYPLKNDKYFKGNKFKDFLSKY